VPRRQRLDKELVRRGLARSRDQAVELVTSGRVSVAGTVATKPATAVTVDAAIVVTETGDGRSYVSRGAHKLLGAVEAFVDAGMGVDGRRCLDAGASTGGFTEVLLEAGAAEVVAVDVGYGQLAWKLRQDPRVQVLERTNVRELTPDAIGGPVDGVVADLSFISLTLVLDSLIGVCVPSGWLALMVKPQFEVGKDKVGAGGVVRDLGLRAHAVATVAAAAADRGWGARAVTTSPLPGPSGNVEYFLLLAAGEPRIGRGDIEAEVARTAGLGARDERLEP
jgi:23S rRNA (cytidine1920-2'-O)/16S rRNA (cytidine1409-2'-O)-methyltransferase